jgi:pimeloyl-ACP methyl ester carboxylesterase
MRFPVFLPPDTINLTESTSIALAQSIQRVSVPIEASATTIATAYACRFPRESTADGDDGNTRIITDGTTAVPAVTPIVLLHGFDSSLLEFRRLLPLLGEQRPTWAIDLLGFGFTDRAMGADFTPAGIKAHLYATWKTLIKQPMVLVGASMGGSAAIDFALTYPEAVAQLVLIDGAGFAKGPVIAKILPWFPAIGSWAAAFLSRPDVRQTVSRRAYYDDQRWVTPDADCCAALHLAMPRWQAALVDFTLSGGYNFLSDQIGRIAVPSLIIWGRHDRILGTKDATRFVQTIAGSQLVWIEDCGHVPHLEQPATTAAAILEFVHSHTSGANLSNSGDGQIN